jgi:hypothetical protein
MCVGGKLSTALQKLARGGEGEEKNKRWRENHLLESNIALQSHSSTYAVTFACKNALQANLMKHTEWDRTIDAWKHRKTK